MENGLTLQLMADMPGHFIILSCFLQTLFEDHIIRRIDYDQHFKGQMRLLRSKLRV